MTSAATRDFGLVGLSHRSAPVAIRERLAVPAADFPEFLAQIKAAALVDELMIVSTCNRVEALLWGDAQAPERVREALALRAGTAEGLYLKRGTMAVEHLFRVAASLDSMVLGEPQILGQVKQAFAAAKDAGVLGSSVAAAAQAAFAAAKRVRTETAIGAAPVSMASAAVELARKVFGGMDGKTVLLVGAGKMSELTARHLISDRSSVLVVNRTFARAEELAQRVGGTARQMDELPQLLAEADIVVSSTSSPVPVITRNMLSSILRSRHFRPLFLVDLAVPRDIEPEVGQLENVFAYDVDDLGQVVAEGRLAREAEALKAERIVRSEVERFLSSHRVRGAAPVIAQLRSHAERIAAAEAERTLATFGETLTAKQRKSIEAMGRAIVNKLLHEPTLKLREAAGLGSGEAAALAVCVAELFGLPPETESAAGEKVPAATKTAHGDVPVRDVETA